MQGLRFSSCVFRNHICVLIINNITVLVLHIHTYLPINMAKEKQRSSKTQYSVNYTFYLDIDFYYLGNGFIEYAAVIEL